MTEDGQEKIEALHPSLHDAFQVEKGAAAIRVMNEGRVERINLKEQDLILCDSDNVQVGYLYGAHDDEQRRDPLFVYALHFTGITGTVGSDKFTVKEDEVTEVYVVLDPRGATNLIANMILTFFPGELHDEVFSVVKQMGEKHQSAQMMNGVFDFLQQEADKRKEKPDDIE